MIFRNLFSVYTPYFTIWRDVEKWVIRATKSDLLCLALLVDLCVLPPWPVNKISLSINTCIPPDQKNFDVISQPWMYGRTLDVCIYPLKTNIFSNLIDIEIFCGWTSTNVHCWVVEFIFNVRTNKLRFKPAALPLDYAYEHLNGDNNGLKLMRRTTTYFSTVLRPH